MGRGKHKKVTGKAKYKRYSLQGRREKNKAKNVAMEKRKQEKAKLKREGRDGNV